MVVLDTDHLSLLEWSGSPEAERLRGRLQHVPVEERATTIITFEEQSRGWLAYVARARTITQQVDAYGKLTRHLRVYRAIRVLEFDGNAATEFQRIRKLRTKLGVMDLRIAAIALAHRAVLLSRNVSHFKQVSDLQVEDWSA